MAKFGIHLGLDYDYVHKTITRIENSSFDSIFVSDSLQSQYEPVSLLSYFAGLTKRVKLGTCVLVLPLRNPYLLAKQVAQIQKVSNRRFILGVGVGWRKREFDLMGIDYSIRGKIADDSIRLMVKAWEKDTFSFNGEFFKVDKLTLNSSLRERPEIWVGGNSIKALQRALKYGDTYIPTDMTVQEYYNLKQKIGTITERKIMIASHLLIFLSKNSNEAISQARSAARYFSENKEEFLNYVLAGSPDQICEKISRYNKAGVEYHVLSTVMYKGKKLLNLIDIFEKEVLPCI